MLSTKIWKAALHLTPKRIVPNRASFASAIRWPACCHHCFRVVRAIARWYNGFNVLIKVEEPEMTVLLQELERKLAELPKNKQQAWLSRFLQELSSKDK